MQLPRLLVFDLDGTLIDSSLDLCNSVNASLQHVGKTTLPHSLISTYIGDGAAMLVRRALGDPGDLDSANPGSDQVFHTAFNFFLDFLLAKNRLLVIYDFNSHIAQDIHEIFKFIRGEKF